MNFVARHSFKQNTDLQGYWDLMLGGFEGRDVVVGSPHTVGAGSKAGFVWCVDSLGMGSKDWRRFFQWGDNNSVGGALPVSLHEMR